METQLQPPDYTPPEHDFNDPAATVVVQVAP
jgi:hypothetical protein